MFGGSQPQNSSARRQHQEKPLCPVVGCPEEPVVHGRRQNTGLEEALFLCSIQPSIKIAETITNSSILV